MTYSPPLQPTNDNIIANQLANYSNGDGFDMYFSHGGSSPPQFHLPLPRRQPSDPDFYPDSDTEFTIANNSVDFNHSPRSEPLSSTATLAINSFDALKARLLPLQHIEALLIAKLVPPNEDEATRLHAGPSNNNYRDGNGIYTIGGGGVGNDRSSSSRRGHHGRGSSYNQEIFVRPCASWKGALARARVNSTDYPSCGSSSSSSEYYYSTSPQPPQQQQQQRPMSAGNTGLETPDELQEVLSSCRKDMIQLWNDQGVREILRRKKIRLEDASGL